MATPIAVALEDATVAFRVAEQRVYTAVEKASLSVADGEFVAIVGPTGCGKSTLLNVAAGLLKPAGGAVRIFNRPLTGLNADAGYLFQADALFPWKTAIDNVAIGLEIAGTPRSEALKRAQAWLDSVGLGAFAGRFPHMLSGGQRKRVGLAQVLIRDPKILLMDEPFGPLDAQTRQIMGNLLLDLWTADRKAVVFVTHDLEEAIALADRVVIMSAGPGARIIGDWRVPLARPRDIFEARLDKEFHALHREIWAVLKSEVMKSYAQASQGASQSVSRGASQNIVGETPNLARLQGIAEPNTVVIAEATRRLLGNLFELRDLGPKELKGIAGPVKAFAVLRASSVESRFEAMHPGGLTALVGREEELGLLFRRWARGKTGEGQVVLLSGEAGIGKSRLAAAFMEEIAVEPHTRLRYFCSPQHTDSAFYPIIGQFERAAGFAHGDTPQTKLDKLDALLAQTATSRGTRRCWPRCCRFPTTDATPLWSLFPNSAGRKRLQHSTYNWQPWRAPAPC